MIRVGRFLNCYLRHPLPGISEHDVALEVGGEVVPASLIRPVGAQPLPGWILLHGVTVPGRHHPVLTRFAHALAASGATVLIPEVPSWRRLRLTPADGDSTIAAAATYLRSRSDVAGEHVNLVGFSFGATQALMSSALPGIRESVGSVVAFGGYCDLGRTLLSMMTGEHEWGGVQRRLDPDPYGRWIAVGNYLTAIPAFSHMEDLERAAHALAVEAGTRGAYAGVAEYDSVKRKLRDSLPADQRELWDLIAPAAGVQCAPEPGRELARKLVAAALQRDPDLDPRKRLPLVDQRVVLVHGYNDRLIPFTESLRLHDALSPRGAVALSITRLFAHSRGAERLTLLRYPLEIARFVALLNRVLRPR